MSTTAPRDPYDVLGVARDADDTAIKKAFRRLARELHPDVNAHDPDAEDKFKEVAEAYEILSDPERRATFDRYGHDGLRSGGMSPNFEGFGSISDLFDAFFGGGGFGGRSRGGPMQGQDVGIATRVSLEDAARGTTAELSFEAVQTCETCHGNGAEPGTPIVSCERCDGQGALQAVSRTPFGQVVRTVACDVCGGEGKVPQSPCVTCDGRGREVRRRDLSVEIPAGIADGQRVRLPGRGHAGERGGPPGDLYVLVQVLADERFMRDGDDLITALEVPAPLAALGATLPVATLLEGDVDVEIPAGTQPGEVITLRGKGMPQLQRPRAGDLRVVVDVVIPRRLDKRQRELLGELASSIKPDQLAKSESLGGKLKRLFHA